MFGEPQGVVNTTACLQQQRVRQQRRRYDVLISQPVGFFPCKFSILSESLDKFLSATWVFLHRTTAILYRCGSKVSQPEKTLPPKVF